MSTAQAIQEASFQKEVIESPIPVVVEFSAVWCGPCKMLDPVLEQLANEWGDRARLVKVDVDKSVQLVTSYQIMSVPTVILFKGGQPLERLSGYQPKEKIKGKLEPHLK